MQPPFEQFRSVEKSTVSKTEIHRQVKDENTHKYQYCSFGPRSVEGYGKGAALWVHCRFDDECGNGHDTFAITASVRVPKVKDIVAGGCLHDEIAEVFPELKHLIKWHLCSTDGPGHYISNTCYLAGDRDYNGLLKGEENKNPRLMEHFVQFDNVPLVHEVDRRLKSFIDKTLEEGGEFIIDAVEHGPDKSGSGYKFGPKFQFAGMDCKWHECPFDTCEEARQWLDAITGCRMTWTSRTNSFGEGKERELDSARRAAIWPEATDEQLCLPKEELTKLLEARLPKLLEDFRADMEALGFTWLPQ